MKKSLLLILLMALLAPWATYAQKSLPYSYGFEDNDLTTDGWVLSGATSSSTGISSSAKHEGSYGFAFYYSEQSAYLLSPILSGTENGVNVTFYYMSYSSYFLESFQVGYTTDETITNPSLFTYGATMSDVPNSWTLYEYAFPANTKRIAIKYINTNAYYLYLDDFSFEAPPACPKPSALAVSGNGQTATFTWESDADNFSVAYSMNASDDPESKVIGTANTKTFSKADLTLDADHYFWVRANCGTDGESEWAGPVSVHIGYCVPAPSSVDSKGITSVVFGTGADIVNNADANGLPKSSPYYGDYSSMIGAVQASLTAAVDITFATGYSYGTIIWVDWDNSLTFDDDEIVYAGESTSSNPTTLNATFTVPATQPVGDYRMRIAAADSYYDSHKTMATAAGADPCPVGYFTVVNDYTLRVLEAPSCLPPTALEANSITASSAVLNWAGSGTAWKLYYRKVSEADFTEVPVSAHPYTLSNLSSATVYQFKVVAVCGASEESEESMIVNFTTACEDISSFPWSENFESFTANTVPLCWDNSSTTGTDYSSHPEYYWGVYEKSGNKMIRMYNFYAHGPLAIINTPTINLPAEEKELTFDYTHNATSGAFSVKISEDNGETFTELQSFEKGSGSSNSDPGTFTEVTISLAAYANKSVILQFYSAANYGSGAIFVDNIRIDNPPACPKPTELAYSEVGKHSVKLSWTNGAEETAWNVAYKADGDAEYTIQSADSNPYTLSGLEAETDYVVKVQADCGDSQSDWSNEVNFTTPIACMTPLLTNSSISDITASSAQVSWAGDAESYVLSYRTAAYVAGLAESFDASGIPSGWARYSGLVDDVIAGTATLATTTSGWTTTTYALGTNNMKVNVYGTSCKYWLVTPEFLLPTGTTEPMSFDLALTDFGNSDPIEDKTAQADDRFIVLAFADNAWTILREWNNSGSENVFNNISTTGENVSIDISAYKGKNVKFAFYAESTASGGDNDLHIDNVHIGIAHDAGAWQTINAPESPITLSNLTSETIYDVKVQGDCGADGQSAESVVRQFTTASACQMPDGLAVSNITASEAQISWNAYGQTGFNLRYSSDGENWTTISDIVTSPQTLDGLSENTTYQVQVQPDCDETAWSANLSFTTPQIAVNVPFSDDFENGNKWLLVNGNLTNAWAFGEATSKEGEHSLYISNDGGTSNAYTNSFEAMVYATKLFNFEAGKYAFSYDWKAIGEHSGYGYDYDYLRVALVPASVVLTAGTSAPSGFGSSSLPSGWIALDGGNALNNESDWQLFESAVIDVPVAGEYKMVLAWRDDTSSGDNPPAAVDNIHIVKVDSIYVNDSRYATFYTENYAYIMPEGLTGYAFTVESHMSDAIYEADDIVPANAALVLESAKGDTTYWPVPTFVDVPNMSVTNDLHGVNEATIIGSATDGKAYYVLSMNGSNDPESVGFYYMLEDGKGGFELPAHKAYLVVDNPSSAPAAFYLFNGENGATWLENLQGVEGTVKFMHEGNIYILRDSIIYDATGRKVRELK